MWRLHCAFLCSLEALHTGVQHVKHNVRSRQNSPWASARTACLQVDKREAAVQASRIKQTQSSYEQLMSTWQAATTRDLRSWHEFMKALDAQGMLPNLVIDPRICYGMGAFGSVFFAIYDQESVGAKVRHRHASLWHDCFDACGEMQFCAWPLPLANSPQKRGHNMHKRANKRCCSAVIAPLSLTRVPACTRCDCLCHTLSNVHA